MGIVRGPGVAAVAGRGRGGAEEGGREGGKDSKEEVNGVFSSLVASVLLLMN